MRSPLLLALLSSTFAIACAVEAPALDEQPTPSDAASDSRDQNLLVRVNRGPDQSISFLAVEQGAVLVTQTGGKGAFPLQLSDDALTAFQQAAPGHAIPAVLAAAAQSPKAGELAAPVEFLVPAQPVVIDLEAPVIASSFPASSFVCWARNRYTCLYNQLANEGLPGNSVPGAWQTINLVWAVDRDMLPVQLVVAKHGGGSDIYYYNIYDGNWMTWSLSGTFAIFVESNFRINQYNPIRPNARFHFSSAGAQ